MNEPQMDRVLAGLILKKGARLKLQQRGMERGIAGTLEEIYAVDRPLLFTREELAPLGSHVLYYGQFDENDELIIKEGSRIYTQSRVVFKVDTGFFTFEDARTPEDGSFCQYSRLEVEMEPARVPYVFQGTGVLVMTPEGKIALHRRDANAPVYPNKLASVSGGLEEGEEPWQAAIREVQEELGLSISRDQLVHIADMKSVVRPQFYDRYFLAESIDVSNAVVTEGQGIEVFDVAEALKRNDLTRRTRDALEILTHEGWRERAPFHLPMGRPESWGR